MENYMSEMHRLVEGRLADIVLEYGCGNTELRR